MYRSTLPLFILLLVGCAKSPEAEFGRYLREAKQFQEKRDYQRAILQLRNASQAMPKASEPYYQLGMIALAMGNANAALELLKQAVTLDPKRLDASIALAELLIQSTHQSTVAEGRKLAERALAIRPENVKAQHIIAFAELRAGEQKAAEARLLNVLKRLPNDVETSINLARVLMSRSDRKGAEDLLRNAATASPQNATALFALADFCNLTGTDEQAVDYYARGLRIQVDHPQALAALGRLYARVGRSQDADATFAQLAKNPDRRFRYSYGMRLFETGRKDSAIAEFARIFKEDPADREARTHLINAYLDSNRTREAEQLLASHGDLQESQGCGRTGTTGADSSFARGARCSRERSSGGPPVSARVGGSSLSNRAGARLPKKGPAAAAGTGRGDSSRTPLYDCPCRALEAADKQRS